jgi:hypothetical protein
MMIVIGQLVSFIVNAVMGWIWEGQYVVLFF